MKGRYRFYDKFITQMMFTISLTISSYVFCTYILKYLNVQNQVAIVLGSIAAALLCFTNLFIFLDLKKLREAKELERKTLFIEENLMKILNPSKIENVSRLYEELSVLPEKEQDKYLQVLNNCTTVKCKGFYTDLSDSFYKIKIEYVKSIYESVTIYLSDTEEEIIEKILDRETYRLQDLFEIEDSTFFKKILKEYIA